MCNRASLQEKSTTHRSDRTSLIASEKQSERFYMATYGKTVCALGRSMGCLIYSRRQITICQAGN